MMGTIANFKLTLRFTATRWSTFRSVRGRRAREQFWEALNSASNGKLPVVFVVEDNGYAISTPVEVNTPGGNILEAGVAKFLQTS